MAVEGAITSGETITFTWGDIFLLFFLFLAGMIIFSVGKHHFVDVPAMNKAGMLPPTGSPFDPTVSMSNNYDPTIDYQNMGTWGH